MELSIEKHEIVTVTAV